MHAYLIVGSVPERRIQTAKSLCRQAGGRRFDAVVGQDLPIKSITIDQVRHLKLITGLSSNTLRVIALLEVQRLTAAAQHALLKTLEEPGPNIRIIMTADSSMSLLPTICSRCKIIRLVDTPIATDTANLIPAKLKQLLSMSAGDRVVGLFHLVAEVTGKPVSIHRGGIPSDQAREFLQTLIAVIQTEAIMTSEPGFTGNFFPTVIGRVLRLAALAHRLIRQNVNPTLALTQFALDI